MSAPVRIGFVGAGANARHLHYPTLAELDDVELAAVCDLDPERRAAVAAQYGIPDQYEDVAKLFARSDIDAVYIVVAPGAVYELVLAALRAGKHVFTEKPPGVTAQETEQLASEAERLGRITTVGFNRRFTPVLRAARDEVLRRGPLSACNAIYHKNHVGQTPPWGSGDWLLADGVHALDTLLWLADSPVARVSSSARRFGDEPFATGFAALIEFENGCMATYSGQYRSGARQERFELHGTGIAAYVSAPQRAELFMGGPIYHNPPPERVFTAHELTGRDDLLGTYGYVAESRNFIDAIKGQARPECTLADTVATMRLADAIRRSDRA